MKHRRSSSLVAALVAIPLAAAANQQSGADTAGEPAPAEARQGAQASAQGPARLNVASEQPYGDYLVDGDGRALYMFTPDRGQKGSTCYGACAAAWPPLLTEGDPRAAAPGLDADRLGTIERRDGSLQVTYDGWPLYYYVKDEKAGQVTGQDIHGFGGEWYLLSPAGTVIKATEKPAKGHEHQHEHEHAPQ